MCRRVLLVVLWLLIGTDSRLLVVGLLSIAEALCQSLCLFGTILVTLCLMVWDWRVSRAESMLSCWHDLFLFCLLLFYLFLPSMVWLCGVWCLWTDSVLTLSRPCTADSKIIIIIIWVRARYYYILSKYAQLQTWVRARYSQRGFIYRGAIEGKKICTNY